MPSVVLCDGRPFRTERMADAGVSAEMLSYLQVMEGRRRMKKCCDFATLSAKFAI